MSIQKTILVVDDSEADRQAYQRAFRDRIGYTLTTAPSAEAGLVAVAGAKPDLILLDYNLPDMNGMTFMDKLAGFHIPVIMLTGEGNESLAVEAMKHGAVDYMVKNVDGRHLKLLPSVVEKALQNHDALEGKKAAEKALKESEQKFHLLFDNASDCNLLLSEEGLIVDINRIGYERLGYTKQEMLGRNITEFDSPEFAERVPQRLLQIKNEGYASFESAHMHKDGSVMPVEVNSSSIELDGKQMYYSIVRDITERKRMERELSLREARYRGVIETSPDGFWTLDTQGRLLDVNDAYVRLSGYSSEELLGMSILDLDAKESPEETAARIQKVLQIGYDRFETFHRKKDGKVWPVEVVTTYWPQDGGRFFVFCKDITEQRKTEEALRVAAVAFEAHDAIVVTDQQVNILRVNRAFTEITGYSQEEVLGKNPRILSSGQHDKAFYNRMWQQLLHTGYWEGEIWDKRKNGQIYPKWMTITAVMNEHQEHIRYVAIFSDITARKQAEEEIRNLAFYDPLTKLPNRRLLLDRFHAALAASVRHNDYGATLFIDLDRFKTLNDTLGHDYGDLLLKDVGMRIKSCIREMDTVARFGGDEFVVLIESISKDRDDAAHKVAVIAEKIREALARPYQLKKHVHHSSPSIGISLYHGNEESVDLLLERADMAMYQAKSSGRNTVRFFNSVRQQSVATHEALENDLHRAIELRQLHLQYQVQVDNSNRPLGAEAFLRWEHPERGTIMPGQFIPLAEESSLIIEIGNWVLQTACQQLAKWSKHEKTRDLTLTINISAKQFAQPDFANQVADILKKHQADPTRLKMELSEKVVLTDIGGTVDKIHALRNIGIRLSMDNFSTVYSSLSYLKQLSSDQIKIHHEFVRGISLEGNDAQLVQSIIDLAKSLDLDVFAEGVETEEQRIFLQSHDCTSYQGYLFSKPVAIEEFEALLDKL